MSKKQPVLFLVMVILAGLALLTMGCQATTYQYKGNLLNPPQPVPDFELMATDGRSFHLSDLEGKVALVFFGYTNCPDVCPLTVAKVQQTLTNLDQAERERVKFIFISTDPERDTPEVLARYLSNFNSEFIGLTDDFEKTQTVMKAYWAYAEKAELLEPTAGQVEASHDHAETTTSQAEARPTYLVQHTARVYLVTPQRELLLMYPSEFEAEDLRSDLIYLFKQM